MLGNANLRSQTYAPALLQLPRETQTAHLATANRGVPLTSGMENDGMFGVDRDTAGEGSFRWRLDKESKTRITVCDLISTRITD